MRSHEAGISLIEIVVAAFLIAIAIIPMLELYPVTLGANRETGYDLLLSTAALRKLEENINLLRGGGSAVEFDAFATGGSAGAQSNTCTSMTIASNANYFVIQVGINGTTAVSSILVSNSGRACNTGSNASFLVARTSPSNRRSEIWRLLSPPTGTVNVRVNMAASIRHAWVAASFKNVLTGTPLGGNNYGDADATPPQPAVTISPRTANSMMVGGFFYETPGITITQGGGQTAIGTGQTTGSQAISTHLARETNQGDAGIDMTWTVDGGNSWVSLAIELRGQAAAADPNGSATCSDLPNCLLVWTTALDPAISPNPSTTSGVGSLKTLNVTACEDTNANSACDAGERQVRYDAKITTRP